MIKFRELIPGILSLLKRLPSIIRTLKKYKSLDDEDYLSIGVLLERNAVTYAHCNALLFEGKTYTYNTFNEKVNQYAHYLLSLGLKKGDTTVVLMENRPEMLFCMGAASKIGAAASLINPNLRGDLLQHCIESTPCDIFFIGEELIEAFKDIKENLSLKEKKTFLFVPDQRFKAVPQDYIDISDHIKMSSKDNPSTTLQDQMKDPFGYIFTSGTTGLPKASVQLHKSWIGAYYWIGKININLTQTDIIYMPLPLYHTTAAKVAWPVAVAGGAAMALCRKFSASNFWNDVRSLNATSFVYVGELCSYLLNQPASSYDQHNPIKKIFGNGLRPDIWLKFKDRFKIPEIFEFFGASESPIFFINTLNLDETIGMCFFPPYAVVKYDVKADAPIRDASGYLKRIDHGDTGLVLGKILNLDVFPGYTDENATKKKILRDVFQKGDAWFNTGDLIRHIGYRNYQFADRIGDTFRWKGENVATTEVEKVVNSFHQVNASTVYGVRIPGFDGRIGMAAVIPNVAINDFHLKEFAEILQKALPAYAVPRFVRCKTEFETTQTFKIKKSRLKEDGFRPDKTEEHVYVLLPHDHEYKRVTKDLYEDILSGKYRF